MIYRIYYIKKERHTKTIQSARSAHTELICLCVACCLYAENIVFPTVPGVIDITKPPYSADKSGKTDVAPILNDVLTNQRSEGTWGPRIIYLPNGTYLVKSAVSWKKPPYTVGPHLHGQSRHGTVILLADSTFKVATQPGYMISSGSGVAQNFSRGIFNLTINTGKGNAGAIGIFWYGNNESLISDVDIISGDGGGIAGMRIGTNEEGPAGVRRVYIRGFRYGVWSTADLNTVTFTQLSLEGQSMCGIIHETGFPIYIDSLTSRNSVPVVLNRSSAQMVLINGYFTGGNPDTAAIINSTGAMLFVRNIRTGGYKQALSSTSHTVAPPSGAIIDEWSSHGVVTLFDGPQKSLNLPIKRAPEPEWEQDMNKWADVTKYTTGRTDQAALQAAIDDPTKTAVILPQGRDFNLAGDVYVRGNIRMLVCAGAGFIGAGSLVVTDAAGAPPVVKLWKVTSGTNSIVQQSSRTVVIEASANMKQFLHSGSGDLFITDATTGVRMTNPAGHLWAWHFNAESGGGPGPGQLDMTAGTAWIFGWKDEGAGISAKLAGGTAEVLGYFNYGVDTVPEIVVSGTASAFFASGVQCRWGGKYNLIIREIRNGVTKVLDTANNSSGFPTHYDFPAYAAYAAAAGTAQKPSDEMGNGHAIALDARQFGRSMVRVRWTAPAASGATILLVNSRGQTVNAKIAPAGQRSANLDAAEVPRGIYRIILQTGCRRVVEPMTIIR